MKRYLAAFLCAVLVSVLVIGAAVQANAQQPQPEGRWLKTGFLVRGQMTPADVDKAAEAGFRTIIDLRPNSEEPGQPSAEEMSEAAKRSSLTFHYVPVPRSGIPDEAIAEMKTILEQVQEPVVMYCRSGMRATRTWALAEASRPGGAEADAIMRAVQAAGFPMAADLEADITARTKARVRTGN